MLASTDYQLGMVIEEGSKLIRGSNQSHIKLLGKVLMRFNLSKGSLFFAVFAITTLSFDLHSALARKITVGKHVISWQKGAVYVNGGRIYLGTKRSVEKRSHGPTQSLFKYFMEGDRSPTTPEINSQANKPSFGSRLHQAKVSQLTSKIGSRTESILKLPGLRLSEATARKESQSKKRAGEKPTTQPTSPSPSRPAYLDAKTAEEFINALGLNPKTVAQHEFKEERRKLLLMHHPDKGGNPADFAHMNKLNNLALDYIRARDARR